MQLFNNKGTSMLGVCYNTTQLLVPKPALNAHGCPNKLLQHKFVILQVYGQKSKMSSDQGQLPSEDSRREMTFLQFPSSGDYTPSLPTDLSITQASNNWLCLFHFESL